MTDFYAKNAKKQKCNICDFTCNKKSDWDRHLITRKHINNDKCLQKNAINKQHVYTCECGKHYKHRQSLSLHRKNCNNNNEINNNEINNNEINNNGLNNNGLNNNGLNNNGLNNNGLNNNEINNNEINNNEINNNGLNNNGLNNNGLNNNGLNNNGLNNNGLNNNEINNNEINNNEINNNEINNKDNVISVLIKENIDFKNIILDLVKNNGDLQKQMIDLCKHSNITNINTHNNTFNMQFFLNEKCKDAMNIMDFVNSMTLQLSDLEDVGNLGYVEGISRIIIKKLNEMDIYKRPIHCSDMKREVMYVKENDIWEKENSTYDKLRKAIKYITKKNGDLLIPWSEKHPLCMNIEHPQNEIYMLLMNQSMGGKEEFMCSENKIIKKISKAVIIDKL